jgi:hypothetical protein
MMAPIGNMKGDEMFVNGAAAECAGKKVFLRP